MLRVIGRGILHASRKVWDGSGLPHASQGQGPNENLGKGSAGNAVLGNDSMLHSGAAKVSDLSRGSKRDSRPWVSGAHLRNMSKRSWHLLLCDADSTAHEAVRVAAARAGHRVTCAQTGGATLELAASTQPDIIVLDLSLSDEDGRDVLRKLKADPRTTLIPVLVWSVDRHNDSDSRISLALGAEDYVEKNDALLLIRKLERVFFRLEEASPRKCTALAFPPSVGVAEAAAQGVGG